MKSKTIAADVGKFFNSPKHKYVEKNYVTPFIPDTSFRQSADSNVNTPSTNVGIQSTNKFSFLESMPLVCETIPQ